MRHAIYPERAEFWLFPADSVSGQLIEHKEDRKVLSKWGNDLRQSYRTLAQIAGVSFNPSKNSLAPK